MHGVTHDPRLRFLVALACWSAALLALLRSPPGQQAIVAPFAAWHAAFASGFSGGSAVTIDLSCSGSDVIALSIASLLAYPVPWRRRLSGVAFAVVWLCCLNIVRIITLVNTVGSPLFLPLHTYIWPALMIGGSAAFVFAWIWMGRRAAAGLLHDDLARTRRLVAVTGVLVVAYVGVTPWLLASQSLQQAAMALANTAATLLRAVGQNALTGGGTLVVAQQSFLVTPECIVTPLIPIYLGWALTWPRDLRTRVGTLVLLAPLFAGLGLLRLLTVALPAIIGPPLFLTHGFYQLVIAVLIVAGAARWRAQRQGAESRSTTRRLGSALLTAIGVAVVVAGPYTSLVQFTARVIAPPPTLTLATGGPPTADVQGALSILPGYELALLCSLAIVLWGSRAARMLAVLVPIAAALQVATLIVAGHLGLRFAAEVPVTFVRAVSIITPCLLVVAAASAHQARAGRPRRVISASQA